MPSLYHRLSPRSQPPSRPPSHHHHQPPVPLARPRSFHATASPPDDMPHGTSLFDSFDFALSTPSTSAHLWSTWPASPPPSPTGFADPDPRDALERDICSNFACCGLALADLHELLAHFEDRHVLVLPSDDAHPSASTSASAPAPLILSYPEPRTLHTRPSTPRPLSPLLPLTPSSSASMSAASSPVDSAPATPWLKEAASPSSMRSPSPAPIALPPALFSIPRAPNSGAVRTRESKEERRGPGGRFRPRRPEGDGHGRKRERMYSCPRPRCTKSYLNPNGLKYHLEKGTCNFESNVQPLES